MLQSMLKAEEQLPVRDLLFGDLPLDYWAGTAAGVLPWTLFEKVKTFSDAGADKKAIETLIKILSLPGLESRQYLQAHYFLRQLYDITATDTELLGVVAEVAMEEGLDLLAVYKDHTARYYNNSGGGVVWENSHVLIDTKIERILSFGREVIKQIGPWTGKRPAAPAKKSARISFLTSTGLHFGQANQAVLFQDPMVGKTMFAMLDMMAALINISGRGNN